RRASCETAEGGLISSTTETTAATTRSATAHPNLFRAGIVRLVGLRGLVEVVEVTLDAVVVSGRNLLLQNCLAVTLLDLLNEALVFLFRVPLVADSLGLHREEHLAGGDGRFGLLGLEVG